MFIFYFYFYSFQSCYLLHVTFNFTYLFNLYLWVIEKTSPWGSPINYKNCKMIYWIFEVGSVIIYSFCSTFGLPLGTLFGAPYLFFYFYPLLLFFYFGYFWICLVLIDWLPLLIWSGCLLYSSLLNICRFIFFMRYDINTYYNNTFIIVEYLYINKRYKKY